MFNINLLNERMNEYPLHIKFHSMQHSSAIKHVKNTEKIEYVNSDL